MSDKEHLAVKNFRDYIRIKSVQPNPDYAGCVTWLEDQAREIGAAVMVTECVPGKPVVVLTLQGQDPTLPSILLNSHTDVVPVFPEHWTHDPFGAFKDAQGNIYGRGTQDMKCIAVMYLEALKKLQKDGHKFLRTIHLSFVPDEEIGGWDGMGKFVETVQFKKMNVGFALDEGIASTSETFFVYYGQRYPIRLVVNCPGQPGHGSQFLKNTAGEKVSKVLKSFYKFREAEEQRLKDDPLLKIGDVTTINLTIIEGGVQFNVVPSDLQLKFDIRVAPSIKLKDIEEKFSAWCREAGEGITFSHHEPCLETREMACVKDGECPWWDAFTSACKSMGAQIQTEIFPASTDLKFIRRMGIPGLGFSPINHTEVLLHHHNEYLNEEVLLRGIDIYAAIIPAVANLKPGDI